MEQGPYATGAASGAGNQSGLANIFVESDGRVTGVNPYWIGRDEGNAGKFANWRLQGLDPAEMNRLIQNDMAPPVATPPQAPQQPAAPQVAATARALTEPYRQPQGQSFGMPGMVGGMMPFSGNPYQSQGYGGGYGNPYQIQQSPYGGGSPFGAGNPYLAQMLQMYQGMGGGGMGYGGGYNPYAQQSPYGQMGGYGGGYNPFGQMGGSPYGMSPFGRMGGWGWT